MYTGLVPADDDDEGHDISIFRNVQYSCIQSILKLDLRVLNLFQHFMF